MNIYQTALIDNERSESQDMTAIIPRCTYNLKVTHTTRILLILWRYSLYSVLLEEAAVK